MDSIKCIRKRDKMLYKRNVLISKLRPVDRLSQRIKEINKKINGNIVTEKRNYYYKKIEKNKADGKKHWKILKEICGIDSGKKKENRINKEKVIQDYANMKKEIDLIKIENVELRKKVMNSEIMEENKLLRENRNALEIHGTQITVNEDLKQTAIKLGDAAKVVLSKEEIVDSYRLGKRDKNGAIFVRFATSQKRDEYLQKTKKIRPTSRSIGQEPRDNKIYINEALIPSRKYLFYKTKQLVQEKNGSRFGHTQELYI